jgi:hypothetical protein
VATQTSAWISRALLLGGLLLFAASAGARPANFACGPVIAAVFEHKLLDLTPPSGLLTCRAERMADHSSNGVEIVAVSQCCRSNSASDWNPAVTPVHRFALRHEDGKVYTWDPEHSIVTGVGYAVATRKPDDSAVIGAWWSGGWAGSCSLSYERVQGKLVQRLRCNNCKVMNQRPLVSLGDDTFTTPGAPVDRFSRILPNGDLADFDEGGSVGFLPKLPGVCPPTMEELAHPRAPATSR